MLVTLVWILLALLWGLDALRLRRRARALAVLAPSQDAPDGFRVVGDAPAEVVAAAAAHARREGLEALDLVPADLPTPQLLLLLSSCDPASCRRTRIAPGRGAGNAILVSDALLARIPEPPDEPAALALKAKLYASSAWDLAIAPGLRARPLGPRGTRRRYHLFFGALGRQVLAIQVLFSGLALAGPFVARVAGCVALALLHHQAAIVTAGTALRPRDRLLATLLRAPLDLARSVAARLAPPPPLPDRVTPLRPVYAELVAEGTGRFFEPRREDCPLCGDARLERVLETPDLLQHKPGSFRLDRCVACRHIFQNPRLSVEGLDYYYRDCYDGLNQERVEAVFSFGPYRARAEAVAAVVRPTRWLDVGGGHGHFSAAAAEVYPDARFDALDMSHSILEAERRGWIGRGWIGLFPERAAELAAEAYDVVSMSHYLEHTRDPRAEIAAAARVLGPGGCLFIEVPDPECRMRHLLGRYWIPWFQPQHQHFLTVKNLERLLREEGFEPVSWQRGAAHSRSLGISALFLLARVLPAADEPWRPAPALGARVLGALIVPFVMPTMFAASLVERLLGPLFRRPGWSSAYRVVARRLEPAVEKQDLGLLAGMGQPRDVARLEQRDGEAQIA
jgi:ubiquinone/menaquinone biosynthesis C-methylase UbiE